LNPQIQAKGVSVIGVSPDTVETHQKFRDEHKLPFVLLADHNHLVAERYGVWGEKTTSSGTTIGMIRSSFLIDADGRIEKFWRNVSAQNHPADALAAL
jgi:thioredoxin-dependent peroxiredoxin